MEAHDAPATFAYTVGEVAQLLKCSERHIRDLLSAGRLPAVKVGRLTRILGSDLEAYLASQRTATPPPPTAASLRLVPPAPAMPRSHANQLVVAREAERAAIERHGKHSPEARIAARMVQRLESRAPQKAAGSGRR